MVSAQTGCLNPYSRLKTIGEWAVPSEGKSALELEQFLDDTRDTEFVNRLLEDVQEAIGGYLVRL